MGDMKCDQCDSVILCVKCDIMYHNHILRFGHIRQVVQVNFDKKY